MREERDDYGTDLSRFQKYFLSDNIITFLDCTVLKVADNMPDSGEVQLPYTQKVEVSQLCRLDYTNFYPNENPAIVSYFLSVWKHNCNYIKVRKVPRFQKFSECERIRAEVQTGIAKGVGTAGGSTQRNSHPEFVGRERSAYSKKTELAKDKPNEYFSLIIDVQTKFSVPRFIISTKDQRLHVFRLQLIRHRIMHWSVR